METVEIKVGDVVEGFESNGEKVRIIVDETWETSHKTKVFKGLTDEVYEESRVVLLNTEHGEVTKAE